MLTRKLCLSVVVFATCFLSVSSAPWAADKPTESDIQQITLKAAALIKDKGVDAGRNAFDAEGEFKYGEIYVNVISEKGVRLVYPPKPAGENMDVLEAQDVDGKYLIKDILELAKSKGEGWTGYRWTNPVTKKIAEKVTYVKSVQERGVIVYVGMYK
jgi:signal transduction histidine kinase